jgi:hypothetical protein
VENAELLRKLKQVEDNAWMLFNELPPCGARTRALHVFLDAKELKSRLEQLPEMNGDRPQFTAAVNLSADQADNG